MTSYGTTSTVQVSETTFTGNGTSTTEDIPQRYFVQYDIGNVALYVIYPFILLFGTFGNVMTVLVLQAKRSDFGGPNICFYFILLAVSDQFVLTLGLARNWIQSVFHYDVRILHVVVCKLHKFAVYSVSRMATWILVALSSERVSAVMWPTRWRSSNSMKRAKIVVWVIIVVCCLVDTGILFVYNLQTMNGTTKCKPLKDRLHTAFYQDKVVPWLNTITGSWLPFVILVVNNCILAYKVRQSTKSVCYQMDKERIEARNKKANTLSITLITISIAFIVLTSPIPASFMIKRVLQSSPSDAKLEADLYLVKAILDLMIFCNYSVNFYLYILTAPTVRLAVRRLLCYWQKLPPKGQTLTSLEEQTPTTTQVKDQTISPVEGQTISPVKSQSISPVESQTISPVKSQSISPVKSQSISPVKSQSISAVESQSISPVKSQSISPVKSQSISPVKSQSISPVKSQSISPVKSQSISPVKSQTISPVGGQTISHVEGTPISPGEGTKI